MKKRDILYMTNSTIDRIFTGDTSQRMRDILDMRWGLSVKASEKQSLLKLSFQAGFEDRITVNFKPDEINQIKKIWHLT